MTKLFLKLGFLTLFIFFSCKESSSKKSDINENSITKNTNKKSNDSLTVYQTENLIIKKLSNHIYQHISYLKTEDFGNVACNGMLVINEDKGVVLDTPTDNEASAELITYVTNELKTKITAVIPTHFHKDCVGGIEEFEENNIQTYATAQTIGLVQKNGQSFSKSVKEFDSTLTLTIGSKKIYIDYFGEGHTKDNIIGYFPEDRTIFGGCLIKEVGAGKGNLADANTAEWSATVQKIKLKYPNAKTVIPGHGKTGGSELFDYTTKLFEL